jgi:hypothetical protein
MATETIVQTPVVAKPTQTGKVNSESFLALAKRYGTVSRICGAMLGVKPSQREANIREALQVLAELEVMALNGGNYTPPVDAGFGPGNAAFIAETLLGTRKTKGAVSSAFVKFGKTPSA